MHDAGEEADVAFVAKDAKGFQKSLGGDIFTVSWERTGDNELATFGQLPPESSIHIDGLRCLCMACMQHVSWRPYASSPQWRDVQKDLS